MSFFTAKKISGTDTPEDPTPSLAVDVYQSGGKLVILVPIAGISIDDMSVSITDEILTIQGRRKRPEEITPSDYFSQECFWGEFSRSVILPVEVDTNKVSAFYKKGTLRIEMPITQDEKTRVIPITISH